MMCMVAIKMNFLINVNLTGWWDGDLVQLY